MCLLLSCFCLLAMIEEPQEPALEIDRESRSVHFPAVFTGRRFNALTSFPQNHHLIVWREGRAVRNALIEAQVSDRAIGEALVTLGATPGDNLTSDAWAARKDNDNPAPDQYVRGPRVRLSFRDDQDRVWTVADFLEDVGAKGFDFRFGGHAHLIPEWQSGCVVCLESCPGARVSNAAYTLRDLERGVARFRKRDDLPKQGTPLRVTLTLVE